MKRMAAIFDDSVRDISPYASGIPPCEISKKHNDGDDYFDSAPSDVAPTFKVNESAENAGEQLHDSSGSFSDLRVPAAHESAGAHENLPLAERRPPLLGGTKFAHGAAAAAADIDWTPFVTDRSGLDGSGCFGAPCVPPLAWMELLEKYGTEPVLDSLTRFIANQNIYLLPHRAKSLEKVESLFKTLFNDTKLDRFWRRCSEFPTGLCGKQTNRCINNSNLLQTEPNQSEAMSFPPMGENAVQFGQLPALFTESTAQSSPAQSLPVQPGPMQLGPVQFVKKETREKEEETVELKCISPYARPVGQILGVTELGHAFNDISDYFQRNNRMRCGGHSHPSPHSVWTGDFVEICGDNESSRGSKNKNGDGVDEGSKFVANCCDSAHRAGERGRATAAARNNEKDPGGADCLKNLRFSRLRKCLSAIARFGEPAKGLGVGDYLYCLRISNMCYQAPQFKVHVAALLIRTVAARTVLDFSCGWGDRLAAFFASECATTYVGSDPNDETFSMYLSQTRAYDRWRFECMSERNLSGGGLKKTRAASCTGAVGDRRGYAGAGEPYREPRVEWNELQRRFTFESASTGVRVVLYNAPAEDVRWSDEWRDQIDLVLTSPPYWTTERYADHLPCRTKQSWHRYADPGAWVTNFLLPVCAETSRCLNPSGGWFMLNVLDARVGRRRTHAVDEVRALLDGLLRYEGVIGMRLKQRPKRGRDSRSMAAVCCEPIWCWKRPNL